MLKKFLTTKSFSYSITSAALVMMIAVIATKITGFARQALYSGQFYGANLDIFYAANLLPEVIFNIIALGSITAVLIPVLTKAISKEGQDKASHIFSSILNIGILFLVICSLLLMIFTPDIALAAENLGIIKKFSPDQIQTMVNMMRILLISPVILGVSSVVTAVLQIKRHFFITQLSPLVYNLSGILSLYIFVPFVGLYGLAIGVVFGSVLHLLVQIPAFLTTGIKYHPNSFEIKNKYTKDTGKLLGPRLFGLAGEQLVLIVQTLIALVYPAGALSAFRNALVLRDIPISLFGVTLAQAAFPTLSASATDDDMTNFKKYFTRTFQQIIFLVLPLAAFIMILRLPIVRLAFGVGADSAFDWNATKLTALILFFMTVGILWLSLVGLLVRAFYAMENTVTPVIVSLVTVIIEVILSIVFSNAFSHLSRDTDIFNIFSIFKAQDFFQVFQNVNPTGLGAVAGIALATAVSSFIQVLILMFLLSRKIRLFKKDFVLSTIKKFLSAFLLAASAYVTLQISEQFFPTDKTFNVFIVLGISFLISFGVYFYSEFLFEDEEFDLFVKMYQKIKGVIMKNQKIVNQVYKSFIISQEKRTQNGS